MKHILLPTDFSANSIHAIRYTMQLYENSSCSFSILYVQKESKLIVDVLMATSEKTNNYQSEKKRKKKELNELVLQLKEENKNQNFTFKVFFDTNSLTDALKKVIISENIDLIIMGSNGATAIKEAIFGSNTLNVIREVDCPVLVIPENYNFKPIHSVLFSTEQCKDFKTDKIKPLTELLKLQKASLSILDINSNQEEIQQHKTALATLFLEIPFDYYSIQHLPVSVAINAAIQLLNFDVHALFIESTSFIDRFIYGTEDDDISYGTKIPLLVLHA